MKKILSEYLVDIARMETEIATKRATVQRIQKLLNPTPRQKKTVSNKADRLAAAKAHLQRYRA